MPPSITISNEKIVRRHVHSVAFAAFLRWCREECGRTFANIGVFFSPPPGQLDAVSRREAGSAQHHAERIALGGRCRDCGRPISARYPLVEVLSAALWVLAGARFGELPQAIAAVFFFYLLMILAFVDLDTMRLPNPLVALVGGGGLAGALVAQFARIPCVPLTPLGASWAASPVVLALVGAAASSVIALVIALAYQSVRGAQGLGMGDVKLLVAIGAFLGVYGVMVLFLGSLLAALWGVTAATMKRLSLRTRVPFGPFLALAAVIVAVAGPQMWAAYLGLVGM